MSYYMGDYYRGDYYQGDPGFFSFLGGLAKKAVGLIPGVGPIASSAIGALSGGTSKMVKMAPGMAIQKIGPIVTRIAKRPGVRMGALGAAGLAAGYGASRVLGKSGAASIPGRRRRRMNVCNPRALRRSIRRTQGFAKLAMRTIHLVHPKKKARFGGFKKRRAKR
jgi:hypothetical protein